MNTFILKNNQVGSLEQASTPNATYISPTPGEITIIAQNALISDMTDLLDGKAGHGDKELVAQHVDTLRAIAQAVINSGCNTISLLYNNGEEMIAMTDLCETEVFNNKTLNVVRNSSSLTNGKKGYKEVLDTKDHTQPKIWELTDEPDYKAWGDILYAMRRGLEVKPEEYNTLAIGMDLVKNLDPSKMVYFNLAFPERDKDGNIPTNNTFLGSCTSYEEYLNNFQFLFKPAFWSFDVYPFTFTDAMRAQISAITEHTYEQYDKFFNPRIADNSIFTSESIKLRSTLFHESLYEFHKLSQRTGRPFWAYCLTQGHIMFNNADRTEITAFLAPPNEAMIRMCVFTALAYGAQGIVYWPFGDRHIKDIDSASNSYIWIGEAPLQVNKTYDTTKTFEYTKDKEKHYVTTDIYKLSLNTSVIGSYVKNVNKEISRYSYIFVGCEVQELGISGPQIPHINYHLSAASSFACIQRIIGNGIANFLFSHITKDDRHYIVIVCQNPFSVLKSVRVDIFKDYEVIPVTSNIYRNESPTLSYNISLSEIEYAIFRFK